jgi:hypothetical protein
VRALSFKQILVEQEQPLPTEFEPALDIIILTDLLVAIKDESRQKHGNMALSIVANRDSGWNLSSVEPFNHHGIMLRLAGVTSSQCFEQSSTGCVVWLEQPLVPNDTLPQLGGVSDSGTSAAVTLSTCATHKRRAAATAADVDIKAVTHYQTHMKAEPPVLVALHNKKSCVEVSSAGQELTSAQRGSATSTERGGTAVEGGASLSTVGTAVLVAVPLRARAGRKPKAQQPLWYHQRLYLANYLMDGLTATLTQLSAKYGRHVGMSRRAGCALSKANGLGMLADYAAAISKMPKRKGKSKMTVWREKVAAARGHSSGGASRPSTAAAAKAKGKLATASGRGGRSKPAASAAAAAAGSSGSRGIDGTAVTTAVMAVPFTRNSKRSIAAADNSWVML